MQVTDDSKNSYKFKIRKVISLSNKNEPVGTIPKGRSGHRIVTSDAFMFAYGGYNPPGNEHQAADQQSLFRELWTYNIVNKKWTLLPISDASFPYQLASMCIGKIGKNILIQGGTSVPFGHWNGNTCHVANVNKNDIVHLEVNGNVPIAKYGHASFFDHQLKRWYMVGGTNGTEFFMNVSYLDLLHLKWVNLWPNSDENESGLQRLSDVPEARYRHEITVYNSQIIIFGGGTTTQVFDFEELPTFDLKTQKWGKVMTFAGSAGYPAPRSCHSGVMVPADNCSDPQFVISGGTEIQNEGGLLPITRPFNDIWSLNLRTWQWYRWRDRLPHPLHFHDASLTPHGKMIIFGGIESIVRRNESMMRLTSKRTNRVLSCWVNVPRLTEMAWEAVLSNFVTRPSPSLLETLGIPEEFIKRTKPWQQTN